MQKCIVVLGMHRSGTTALMGTLLFYGVYLGTRLLGTPSNPLELCEHSDIVNLNSRILSELSSSWDDVFTLNEDWHKQDNIKEHKEKIIAVIKDEFHKSKLWGIKDPRMCILLPMWLDIFKELSITPYFILSVRNPLEIAKSLEERDKFSQEQSLLLWMKHLLNAEYYSRNHHRVFSKYDELLKNPRKAIDKITRALGITLPKSFEGANKGFKSFLKPNLKHHSCKRDTAYNRLPSMVTNLYQLMIGCSDNSNASESFTKRYDDLRRQFSQEHHFFLYPDLKRKIVALEEEQHKVADVARNLAKLSQSLFLKGNYEDSEKLCTILVEILPEKHNAWNNLGVVLAKIGKFEHAIECLEKSLSIKPDYAEAINNIKEIKKMPAYDREKGT